MQTASLVRPQLLPGPPAYPARGRLYGDWLCMLEVPPKSVESSASGVFGGAVVDLGESPERHACGGVDGRQFAKSECSESTNNVSVSFHGAHSAVYGNFLQPHLGSAIDYRIRMKRPDLKTQIWESASRLMRWRYGREHLSRLASDCGFGLGTSSRLKLRETDVQVGTLDAIAEGFGFQAWQLLVPDFDPKAPPVLFDPSDEEEAELLSIFRNMDKDNRPALLARARTLLALDKEVPSVRDDNPPVRSQLTSEIPPRNHLPAKEHPHLISRPKHRKQGEK